MQRLILSDNLIAMKFDIGNGSARETALEGKLKQLAVAYIGEVTEDGKVDKKELALLNGIFDAIPAQIDGRNKVVNFEGWVVNCFRKRNAEPNTIPELLDAFIGNL